MKKSILLTLLCLLGIGSGMTVKAAKAVEGPKAAKAGEPMLYTNFLNDTLTYYYDDKCLERIGATEFWNPGSDKPRLQFVASWTKYVVIDPSMRDYEFTTLKDMFFGGTEGSNAYALSNAVSIEGLYFLNTSKVTDMSGMFRYCRKVKELDVRGFDTRNVEDMNEMFAECNALQEVNIAGFNFDKLKRCSRMFLDCRSLKTIYCNADWTYDAPKLKSSTAVFNGCTSITGPYGAYFDPEMTGYFYGRPDRMDGAFHAPGYFTAIQEVYTDAVETKRYKDPFGVLHIYMTLTYYYDDQRAKRKGTVEVYDPVNLDGKVQRFYGYAHSIDVINVDASMKKAKLTSMRNMFHLNHVPGNVGGTANSVFELNGLENLNTDEVTDMSGMFYGFQNLKYIDVSMLNTSKVTDMSWMFSEWEELETLYGLMNFNTEKVTNMSHMFSGSDDMVTVNLSSFGFQSVRNVYAMFSNCTALKLIICGEDFSERNDVNTTNMFNGCKNLVGEKNTHCNGINFINGQYARPDGGESRPGYFTTPESKVYTAFKDGTMTYYYDSKYQMWESLGYQVEDYDPMSDANRFVNYHNLVKKVVIDKTMADYEPTSLRWMFYGGNEESTHIYYHLGAAETFEGWEYLNTSKVENMNAMFAHCLALKEFNLNVLDFSSVKYMENMFDECTSLKTIYYNESLSDLPHLEYATDMFRGCYLLVGGNGTTYLESRADGMVYGRPDGGDSKPGFFTPAKEVYTEYKDHVLTYRYDNLRAARSGVTEKYTPAVNRFEGYSADVHKIVVAPSMRDTAMISMRNLFSGGSVEFALRNATTIEGLENLNTSKTENMSYMFNSLVSVEAIDVTSFNTEHVKTMEGMFGQCKIITELDLNGFDMSQVEDTRYMFAGCEKLTTIRCTKDWNQYKNIKYSGDMFRKCEKLVGSADTEWNDTYKTDITMARVDGGTQQPGYFTDCERVYTIADLDNKTLTYRYDAKYHAARLMPVSYVDYSGYSEPAVEEYDPNKRRFFGYNDQIETIIIDPSMKKAPLTSMRNLFCGLWANDTQEALLYNVMEIIGLGNLNTEHVTNMSHMLYGLESMESIPVGDLYTGAATDMSYMFGFCTTLQTLNLDNFDISKVKDMSGMFKQCYQLETIYANKDWTEFPNVESTDMFAGCEKLAGSNGTKYSESYTDRTYARRDGLNGKKGYFSAKNEVYTIYDDVTKTLYYTYDMDRPFESRPTELYQPVSKYQMVSHFKDYSTKVKHIEILPSMANAKLRYAINMFFGCDEENYYPLSNVTEIKGLEYLNTSEVTSMYCMFRDLSKVKTLNVNTLDVSKVTDMTLMFAGCEELEVLYLQGDWSTLPNIKYSDNMFDGCWNLQGGDGFQCRSDRALDKTYARSDGLRGKDGYGMGRTEVYSVFNADDETLTYYYDINREIRGGIAEVYDDRNPNTDRFKGYNKKVKTIVIDESMQIAPLESTKFLFGSDIFPLEYVYTIRGMVNLSTAGVTNMDCMFKGMARLQSLDLTGPNFRIDNLKSTKHMFDNCSALKSISCDKDLSGISAENSVDMFACCFALTGSLGTTYDSDHLSAEYARPDGAPLKPGYFTKSPEVYWVYDAAGKTLTYYYDALREVRLGTVVKQYDPNYDGDFTSFASNVTSIVIDESLKNNDNMTSTKNMFVGLSKVTSITGLENLNMNKVTEMAYMFEGCAALESVDVSTFNTSKVTNMNSMFKGCASLTKLNLKNFSIESLRYCVCMFENCTNLKTIYWNENLSESELLTNANSVGMFAGCDVLEGEYMTKASSYTWSEDGMNKTHANHGTLGYFTGVEEIYTVFVDDEDDILTYYYDSKRLEREGKVEMFNYKNPLAPRFKGYAKDVKTIVIDKSMKSYDGTSLAYLFYGAGETMSDDNTLSNVEQIYDLSNLGNVFEKATSTEGMFKGLSSLTYLNTNNAITFYVTKVKNMNSMFEGCEALENIDFWRFDDKMVVETMDRMFYGCKNLQTIKCAYDWTKLASLESSKDMFAGCEKLQGSGGTVYTSYETDIDYAHPDGNMLNPGYFTATYIVALSIGANGSLDVNEDVVLNKVPSGTHLTFKITPDEGYELDSYEGFSLDGGLIVTSDVELSVTFKRQAFTVRFLDKDGYLMTSQIVYYGEDAVVPSPNSHTGYDFIGWDNDYTDIKADVDINALFELHNYDVSFISWDESVIDEQKVPYGDAAVDPEVPEREGYTFTGWDTEFGKVTEDLTVKATYTINHYTVTLNAENGEITVEPDETELDNVAYKTTLKLTAVPAEGYELDAWTNYDGTSLVVTQDTVVTATFKLKTFTVTFLDFDNNVINEQKIEWGKSAVAPDAPEMEGWHFVKWNTDFSNVKSDLEVKPQYEINTYKVTLLAENGSISVKPDEIDLAKVEYGSTLELTAVPGEGYEFDAWTNYNGTALVVKSDTTVTATFKLNVFEVKFVDYDGYVLKSETVTYGKAATAPDDPYRKGYTFTGWDKNFNVITEDLTVTAQYEINTYKVTLVADHGSISVQPEGTDLDAVPYNTSLIFVAEPEEGYEFDAWVGYDGATLVITSDITITATFKPKSFTVIFQDYDGTELKKETVTYGSGAVAPEEPTREGYTFAGWDKAFNVVKSDLTVTATYTQNTVYIVTFMTWDGDIIAEVKVEEGKSAVAPDAPKREGYHFIGWSKPFDNVTENFVTKAQYEINKYTVTFLNWDGSKLKEETVEYGGSATAPDVPEREGYTFAGWDASFDNITGDLFVGVIFEEIPDYTPQNLEATLTPVGDDVQITLSWDKVKDVVSYELRVLNGDEELFSRNTFGQNVVGTTRSALVKDYKIEPGTYTIHWFVRSTDAMLTPLSDWTEGPEFEITVKSPGPGTGVESIQHSEVSIQKVLRDGIIYIIVGDKTFDASGHLVK